MSREKDLDELLQSIKERREQIDKNIEPVLPPKAYDDKSDDLVWIDNNDIKEKINSKDDELTPPKIYRRDKKTKSENKDNSKKQKQQKANDKKVSKSKDEDSDKKAKKLKDESNDKKQKKTKDTKAKENKEPFVLTFPKLLAIVISCLVIACVVAGGFLYCYKNNLYMFEDIDNGYSFETDIKAEHKGIYDSDHAYMGKISIKDTQINGNLYNTKDRNSAYFYDGADITNKQGIRSIDVSNFGYALENLYSNKNAYIGATQSVSIDNLFESKYYKVIGAFYTNKDANDNLGYVFPYTLNGTLTKQSFADYRDALKIRMLYNTGYDITYDDEILILSSDSNSIMPNYKFVVVCVAMQNIEKTTIVTDSVNIYYPQSYFDSKQIINPYKNAMGLYWKPVLTLDEDEKQTKTISQDEYIEK